MHDLKISAAARRVLQAVLEAKGLWTERVQAEVAKVRTCLFPFLRICLHAACFPEQIVSCCSFCSSELEMYRGSEVVRNSLYLGFILNDDFPRRVRSIGGWSEASALPGFDRQRAPAWIGITTSKRRTHLQTDNEGSLLRSSMQLARPRASITGCAHLLPAQWPVS